MTSGRTPVLSAEAVLEVMEESDEVVFSTTEIKSELTADVSRPTVLDRLDQLEEQGVVGRKDLGTSTAWYLTELKSRRLIEFADGESVPIGQVQKLVGRYGGDRVAEAIEILEENPEITEADFEVLKTAASALAQGRDREQVIETLEVDEVTPGGARKLAVFSEAALLAAGLALLWTAFAETTPLPEVPVLIHVCLILLLTGTVGLLFAVAWYNLRRVGLPFRLRALLPRWLGGEQG
jgi:DNA-binding Lrp family transcriptional regulator